MQSYAYKINLKSSDFFFFLHQNSNNQLKTLPRRYLNGAESINLIFIYNFYCISKTRTNAPTMEYMYINLRFKAKSPHVKGKTTSLLKLYLTKSRDRVRSSSFYNSIEKEGGGCKKKILINKM